MKLTEEARNIKNLASGLGKMKKSKDTIGGMNPFEFFKLMESDPDTAFSLMTDQEIKDFKNDSSVKTLFKLKKYLRKSFKLECEKRNI